jgi:hypothetical protein
MSLNGPFFIDRHGPDGGRRCDFHIEKGKESNLSGGKLFKVEVETRAAASGEEESLIAAQPKAIAWDPTMLHKTHFSIKFFV